MDLGEQAGDINQFIAFIFSGQVKVIDRTGTRTLAVLKEGAFFGELSLLLDNVRNATVVADTTPKRLTKLYRLDARVLDDVIAQFPTQQAIMRKHRLRAVGPVLRLATQSTHGIHAIEGSAETQTEPERIAAVFHSMDVDGSGRISAYQLQPLMQKLGLQMSLEEVHATCLDFDLGDKGGELTFEEFSKLMTTPYQPYASSSVGEGDGRRETVKASSLQGPSKIGMQVWHGKRGTGVISHIDHTTHRPFTVHFETGEILKYTQAKMAKLALVEPI